MRPISRATNEPRLGATMIEMTVVIMILLVTAAAAMPRIVAYENSRKETDTLAKIARLPSEAAAQAASLGVPVRLRDSGDSLIMEKVTPDASGTVTPDSQADQIKEVELGSTIQIDNAQLDGKIANAGTWIWTVYPDGSSDTGALEIAEGSSKSSMVISDHGTSLWLSGEMPDQTQDIWDAGALATRS